MDVCIDAYTLWRELMLEIFRDDENLETRKKGRKSVINLTVIS